MVQLEKSFLKIFFTSTSFEHFESLAKFFEVSSQHIENTALEESIVPERYAQNMKMYSSKGKAILPISRVSISGFGGLGGSYLNLELP